MRNNDKMTFHEKKYSNEYIYPDKEKFTKIVSKYKEADEKLGREKITSPELAKLANMTPEVFRKLLNGQKRTNKRDCIILICILLKMDDETANKVLAYYGMPQLNPRDSRDGELLDMLYEYEKLPVDYRFDIFEINSRLQFKNFPLLDIPNSGESLHSSSETVYEILRKSKKTIAGEVYFGDQYNSLSTEYGFERYECRADMLLENKKNKRRYYLGSSAFGRCWIEEFDEKKNDVLTYKQYKSAEESGEFKEYFLELVRSAKKEQQYMDSILNDTRNYGKRISAKLEEDSICVFFEKFNYQIPERNEYYFMEYKSGECCLFVYDKSVFMKKYLSDEEYSTHYGKCNANVLEVYDSLEKIETLLESKKKLSDEVIILQCRKNAYKKMSEEVLKCLNALKTREVFIQNFEWAFEKEDEVLRWYKIEKNFECTYDEEEDFICRGVNTTEKVCATGTKVSVSFDEIKRAFELGYSDIEQIFRIKLQKGSIEAVF